MVFATLGACGLYSSAAIRQVEVSYAYPDLYREFTIDQDMTDGAVNMWYDINVVGVNQKRYVENADPFIYVNFMSKKKCNDALLKAQFTWRRNENLVRQKIGAAQAALPDRFTQLV